MNARDEPMFGVFHSSANQAKPAATRSGPTRRPAPARPRREAEADQRPARHEERGRRRRRTRRRTSSRDPRARRRARTLRRRRRGRRCRQRPARGPCSNRPTLTPELQSGHALNASAAFRLGPDATARPTAPSVGGVRGGESMKRIRTLAWSPARSSPSSSPLRRPPISRTSGGRSSGTSRTRSRVAASRSTSPTTRSATNRSFWNPVQQHQLLRAGRHRHQPGAPGRRSS